MVKKSRKNYRKNQRGAGTCMARQRGAGYSFGQAVAPEAPYSQEVIGGPRLTPDCLAATRPGLVGPLSGPGGLPGFGGGSRQNMGSEGVANMIGSPKMMGGRYTVDVGQEPINGMPVVSRIGCEGGLVNTSPPGSLANPTPLTQSGGLGTAFYTAPTAGYENKPSDFVNSVGAPVLLQQPYDARIMNPACLKTGGRRKIKKTKRVKRSIRKTRRKNRR